MKNFFPVFAFCLLFLTGCFIHDETPVITLDVVCQKALDRNLNGDSSAALNRLARSSRQATKWSKLPDLAAFVRSDTGERKDVLSREILWESAEFCVVQFTPDPAGFIRNWYAGELKYRVMAVLAEKKFLENLVWKSREQQNRESEIHSELQHLIGSMPDETIASLELPMPPAEEKIFPIPVPVPVSEDPAEALQAAGVIYLLPEEIRRQQLSDNSMPLEGVMREVLVTAGSYALYLSQQQLSKAAAAYRKAPTEENLWQWRKWYFRVELDRSRIPAERGSAKDQQFIQSMLLLQANF